VPKVLAAWRNGAMMGERTGAQEALFYGFSLEGHVPPHHMLRSIDRFVDLGDIRERLMPFYSDTGRPSIDPELMLRMLIVGYVMGIRSERRLCDEVHLNVAYRWFCRLGLNGAVPDHSTFSKNRHGRFRESDVLRQLFEATVAACMAAGLVGGEAFAVDASMIRADAMDRRDQAVAAGEQWLFQCNTFLVKPLAGYRDRNCIGTTKRIQKCGANSADADCVLLEVKSQADSRNLTQLSLQLSNIGDCPAGVRFQRLI
jgi:transposase